MEAACQRQCLHGAKQGTETEMSGFWLPQKCWPKIQRDKSVVAGEASPIAIKGNDSEEGKREEADSQDTRRVDKAEGTKDHLEEFRQG